MAKIFITGIAGFLGSHLADTMLSDGHEVAGIDNLIGGYIDNIPRNVSFFQCTDCNNFETMKTLIKGFDIVYHCAATAYEGLSVFSPHLITQNIVSASVGVFSASIANKVKRIVHCSSMARYGDIEIPFKEDSICRPQDPYGIGKLASEDILRNLCNVHGLEYVIAVPHNIIGPRQKYDDPYRNVASIMINLMLQGKQPIIYGDGTQKRCFSFIDDCLFCLKEMAFNDKVVSQVINIGPDEEVITIFDLASKIASLLDFKLDPIYVSGRPQEVKFATCCSDKARKFLNYKTSIPLTIGLRKMIKYIHNRGTRSFVYHLPLEIENEETPKTWKNHLF
jgi:UDP-glucose 4-epimerase